MRLNVAILAGILLTQGCARENVFNEPPDGPVIDSIAPAQGTRGNQIRLYGSGFSANSSENKVSVNGIALRVDSPSTFSVLLATLIDETGTGPVHIDVNGRSADGPIFTWLEDKLTPVITKVELKAFDGDGYVVSVKNLPPTDNGIQIFANGQLVVPDIISRPGSDWYDPAEGPQLLFFSNSVFEDRAILNYVDLVVKANNRNSNSYRLALYPEMNNATPQNISAGSILTVTGLLFGNRTMPSSIKMYWQGTVLSPDPEVVNWNNTKVELRMRSYPNVQPGGGNAPAGYAYVTIVMTVAGLESWPISFYYKN